VTNAEKVGMGIAHLEGHDDLIVVDGAKLHAKTPRIGIGCEKLGHAIPIKATHGDAA
jgi:hypothetical protein